MRLQARNLPLQVVALLLLALRGGVSSTLVLLAAQLGVVLVLEPRAERLRVDLNDAVLHQGLGAHQLVVGGVVHDVQHTGLLGDDCTDKRVKHSKSTDHTSQRFNVLAHTRSTSRIYASNILLKCN